MFLFSAALRSARAARARISTDPYLLLAHSARRDANVLTDETDGPTLGGPFLHWVPDHPDGDRLAGEFLPIPVDDAKAVAAGRPRRRR
ncbi:hypothetical protein [Pseudonocardia endophytica]|uniref:Uncharacterized protein n=1 Tax=Pseudonocardia endophytica TaxID=401976 RepID=A0A4R1I5B9_PSEEN|nr:hypothetical protein [Pseudonocardia endophytica]TCK25232.1 hypothetical protein EV378_1035 [Pseudonocardia endophytica]